MGFTCNDPFSMLQDSATLQVHHTSHQICSHTLVNTSKYDSSITNCSVRAPCSRRMGDALRQHGLGTAVSQSMRLERIGNMFRKLNPDLTCMRLGGWAESDSILWWLKSCDLPNGVRLPHSSTQLTRTASFSDLVNYVAPLPLSLALNGCVTLATLKARLRAQLKAKSILAAPESNAHATWCRGRSIVRASSDFLGGTRMTCSPARSPVPVFGLRRHVSLRR